MRDDITMQTLWKSFIKKIPINWNEKTLLEYVIAIDPTKWTMLSDSSNTP